MRNRGTTDQPMSTTPDRLLPASDVGERGVICSFLLAPVQVHALCQEREIDRKCFHNPALATIYATLVELMDAPKPPDTVILTATLANKGLLDSVGGPGVVAELFTYLPTATNVKYYLDLLEEKLTFRGMLEICREYEERVYVEQENDQLLAEFHEAVTKLTLRGTKDERTFRQILIDTPQRWQETRDGLTGKQLFTGFPTLDKISPIRRKHTVVISGREKSGKSALAGGIVLNAAHVQRIPTLVFPLEMPSEEWIDRLLSEHGSLSQRAIHSGTLGQEDMQRAAMVIGELGNAPIDIFDSFLSLPKIIAKMRQWKAKHASGGLVVVDYLQLIEQQFVKGRSREQEVAIISKTLRNVGKDLDVAVIELCQLNNQGEARESRAIQQDCTAFWQVVEDTDDHGHVKKGRENYRTLHVKFQRHGERNKRIPFTFSGDWMRFREEEEQEPPLPFEESPRKQRRRTGD